MTTAKQKQKLRIFMLSFSGLMFIGLSLFYESMLTQNYLDFANAQTQPRQYLLEQAKERGLNYNLLDRIVWCESHWRMIGNNKSSAYGYFQILDSTEKTTPQFLEGRSKYDPYTNIDMGLYLFETRGSSPWNESRSCWGS